MPKNWLKESGINNGETWVDGLIKVNQLSYRGKVNTEK